MSLHQGNDDGQSQTEGEDAASSRSAGPQIRALVLEHDHRVTAYGLAEGSHDGTRIGKALLEAGSVTHAATVRRSRDAIDSWFTRETLNGEARRLRCLVDQGGVLTVESEQGELVFAYAPGSWQEAHCTDMVTYLISDDGRRNRDPFDA